MATVSKVAEFLGVDKDKVKQWSKEFAEYLSLTVQTAKGKERQYSEADLRVLAVIANHLESGNEVDAVYYALNNGRQYDESLIEIAQLNTPLFQEPPEDMDETWQHGSMIGGMAKRDLLQVGRAYKRAADELLTHATSKYEPHELDYPILFLYRHSLEVYLKAALDNRPEHHDLSMLIKLLETESNMKIAGWIKDRLWDFHQIDKKSALFRYAELVSPKEIWIDFNQLRVVIDKLIKAFEDYIRTRDEC